MAVTTVFEYEKYHNIGLSTDTKPEGQTPLSTFFEYDTFLHYVTYDGTNWVLDTSNNRIGKVTEDTFEVRVSKVIDASDGAYGAKDVINDDNCSTTATAWAFAGMANAAGGFGVIDHATLFDETENLDAIRFELLLFNAIPTGVLTDNVTSTNPIKGDRVKFLDRIAFPATRADGATVATTTKAGHSTYGNLPLYYKCAAGSTTLYVVLITLDVFTQTATDDIEIALIGRKL